METKKTGEHGAAVVEGINNINYARQQQRVNNLEASLAFLKTQHAETLRSLHTEISALKDRNVDATFQLLSVADNELIIKQERERIVSLNAQLVIRDDIITKLKRDITAISRARQVDLESNEKSESELHRQLEESACTVAYLTSQLHNSKVETKQALEQGQKIILEMGQHNRVGQAQSEYMNHHNVPTPPLMPRPLSASSGRFRNSNSNNIPDKFGVKFSSNNPESSELRPSNYVNVVGNRDDTNTSSVVRSGRIEVDNSRRRHDNSAAIHVGMDKEVLFIAMQRASSPQVLPPIPRTG